MTRPPQQPLSVRYPHLAQEWHPTRNEEQHLDDFKAGSNRKFWWQCGTCRREWQTSLAKRTAGQGCRPCSLA
jgi:hypothetical protein